MTIDTNHINMTMAVILLSKRKRLTFLVANPLSKLMKILKKKKINNKNENSIVPSSFLTTCDLLFRIASFSFSIAREGGQLHWLLFIFFKHDTLISYPDSFLYCSCMRTTPSNDADKMHTTVNVVRRSCGFVNVCKKNQQIL